MSLYKINRPISVKIKGSTKVFPKSKMPVEIPDECLEGKTYQHLLETGEIQKLEAPKAPAKAEDPKAPAKK